MSTQSAITRARLTRILLWGVLAVALVVLTVGGLVAYATHVIDAQQVKTQRELAELRVERRLAGLREDLLSATVWNEAFDRTLAEDGEWMQINYGDYYADYMGHEVTLAYRPDGALIFASRESERVDPSTERALVAAVRPLVQAIRRDAAAKAPDQTRARFGLDVVSTVEATIMVGDEPYFVTASSVVPEDGEHDVAGSPAPIVVSGVAVRSFVASLEKDLQLIDPELLAPDAASSPGQVTLVDTSGQALGVIRWTPDRPGLHLLIGAIPALAGMVILLLCALAFGGARVYRLVRELARNEDALDRSLAEAEAANAAKSQFLANMSHELRTPLNGIIAMSEMLFAAQSDDRTRQMTRTIIASGQTLRHVVNDVLDMAKIEAGSLSFESCEFDLHDVLESVADLHRAAASAKGVDLYLIVRESAAGLYLGDKTRVAQLVSNLVSNAVKFTARGSIRVVARLHPHQGLCISVTDSGLGFDRDTAARLFQRFEQADSSISRRFGGTGLGLSICAALAGQMGGAVKVRSIPGRGSTFLVSLSIPKVGDRLEEKVSPDPDGAGPPAEGLAQLRVLYADDHAVNRQVVAMILEPLGVSTTLVEDGAAAVEAFEAGAFDLLLMDVQMPVMDGLTATRRIRELEQMGGRRRTPIISLTANAMPDDVSRSLDAGSDLHLAKPIRPAELISAVDALVFGQQASSDAAAA